MAHRTPRSVLRRQRRQKQRRYARDAAEQREERIRFEKLYAFDPITLDSKTIWSDETNRW